jgi:hypothetical protein
MNTQSTYLQKPSLVSVIAWTTLASGIVNLGWGLVVSATAFLSILGICCTPITILPAILGIFEIIYAAKLLSVPPQPVRPAINLAVLEIVCILTGNVFSMIVGIISLIFYNDPAVKEYFARLNADVAPGAIPPVEPQIPPVVPVMTSMPVDEPIPSPIAWEQPVVPPAPVHDEAPIIEPEPPVPPETSASSNETFISPARRDTDPGTELEPPVSPEEPDPSDKPAE